jgi:hypothetical protein
LNPSLGDGERPRGLLWRSALRPARADGINLPDSPFGGAEEAEFEAMLEEQEAAAAKARTSTRVRAQLATAAHARRARRTRGTPRTATAAAAKATCTVRKQLRAPEPSAAALTPRDRSVHGGHVRRAGDLRLHAGGLGYPGATLRCVPRHVCCAL